MRRFGLVSVLTVMMPLYVAIHVPLAGDGSERVSSIAWAMCWKCQHRSVELFNMCVYVLYYHTVMA